MSKWDYSGEDNKDYFLLVCRGFNVEHLDEQKVIVEMRNTLDASIQGRDQLDRSLKVSDPARWFPCVYEFGGELIQIRSVFPFNGFFALSCKVLDGSHEASDILAAVKNVNDRAYR
ncbi:MAG: hypothetical protein OXC08_18900 [Thiotrichales bacterium]|nr:hypothetical protein [Thiotrichales bacterium]